MKAKNVRNGKDLMVYLHQCGAKIFSNQTGDDYVTRIVVVNKNRSDDRINVACTDGTILWATHYWGGISKSFKPGPLHVVHMDNVEKICKLIWHMSRRKRVT